MNEKDIQSIIKQSMLSPSDNFTDEVMNEISTQNELKYKTNWTIISLCAACLFVFILSFTISLPEINFLKYSVRFPPLILPIVSVIFIFYEFYQLHDLYLKILKSGETIKCRTKGINFF